MSTLFARATGRALRRASPQMHAQLGLLAPTGTRSISKQLFVRNIDPKVDEDTLVDFMSQYGELATYSYGLDRYSGYGVFKADYKDFSSAFAAMDELHGSPLFGQRIWISFNKHSYMDIDKNKQYRGSDKRASKSPQNLSREKRKEIKKMNTDRKKADRAERTAEHIDMHAENQLLDETSDYREEIVETADESENDSDNDSDSSSSSSSSSSDSSSGEDSDSSESGSDGSNGKLSYTPDTLIP